MEEKKEISLEFFNIILPSNSLTQFALFFTFSSLSTRNAQHSNTQHSRHAT